MHIPRFFLPPDQINKGRVIITDPGQLRQISSVLRMKKGNPLIVLDGKGRLYRCRLESIDRESAISFVDSEEPAGGDAPVSVTVALSLLKKDRFEWAVEKMTEVGVNQITPVLFKRSVVRVTGDYENKFERWQRIARESSEQCERATIPQIVPPVSFADLVGNEAVNDLKLVLMERIDSQTPEDVLKISLTNTRRPGKILLVVGCEGGFTEEEFETLQSNSFKMVSLGPRILRSESAAICGANRIISWCERHFS